MKNLHRGKDCAHLIRHQSEPLNFRCQQAIQRYATEKYSFLDSLVWVTAKEASELLGQSLAEVVARAKSGKLPMRYPDNVSKRVIIHGAKGPKEVTLREGAKQVGVTLDEFMQQIESGAVKAFFKDEHIQVQVKTRYQYEKCPLAQSAGVCAGFEKKRG